ncbi:MAG: heavy metal-binding domain-containing protein [Bryobacteraceae bacterium]
MKRRDFVAAGAGGAYGMVARGQAPPKDEFICPMDRDVRAAGPGKCSRCGMKLVANLPDPEQYRLELRTIPRVPQPGRTTRFEFRFLDPGSGEAVSDFEIVHERIFHLFVLHEDLGWFAHEHPERLADGLFAWHGVLPREGAYRLVADAYPRGATPQFLMRTVFTGGAVDHPGVPVRLAADQGVKHAANLDVELITEPAVPVAGQETLLFFRLRPVEKLEQYLAAWGHMLIASQDLVDVIHDHPLYAYPEAEDRPQVQFNVIFPRATAYRIWVQFQRDGVVNTVNFTVPVRRLGE